MNDQIINLEALRVAPLQDYPFPFVIIPDFLNSDYASRIAADFPRITARGSFPLTELKGGETFERLVKELESETLKTAIAGKFDLNLDDRYTMITARGLADKRDGRIHADTKSKFLTVLLYLNPDWNAVGGRLRILRNHRRLDNYLVEIPPSFGACAMFKVTENCWHGHTPFVGPRKVLQLNYIRDEAALNRHILRHTFTAKLKHLRQRLTSAVGKSNG